MTQSKPAGPRAFLARSVCYLAAEAGIRQFLDIGTGLPTASNQGRGGSLLRRPGPLIRRLRG